MHWSLIPLVGIKGCIIGGVWVQLELGRHGHMGRHEHWVASIT
jgi:hypothetical protein